MRGAPVSGAAPSLAAAALQGLCPNCGARILFAGPTRFASQCPGCALNFEGYNVGDGPAAFLILILGAVLAGAAIMIDQLAGPPWWAHLAWLPLAACLTVYGLRLGKAFLLCQEHRHRAREGRLAK